MKAIVCRLQIFQDFVLITRCKFLVELKWLEFQELKVNTYSGVENITYIFAQYKNYDYLFLRRWKNEIVWLIACVGTLRLNMNHKRIPI